MTTQHEPQPQRSAWRGFGEPPPLTGLQRFPTYTEEFAADPHEVYDQMRRQHKTLASVELAPGVPATLVIGYFTAIRINNDDAHFPADPRTWQERVPDDCPVKPMMAYRPNALRSAGDEHRRFRKASVDGIEEINLFNLNSEIEDIAIPQINQFCRLGQADLVGQYAFPLTFAYLNQMVGCPPQVGQDVAQGMAQMFEGANAAEGNALFEGALARLVSLKRTVPGEDLTSRLIAHPADLTDSELVQQLVTIYGAGIEPLTNLIANTLLLMLSDSRFQGEGALTTRDALNELLFKDPPLANFLITDPRQPILVDEVWLPADQPVITSMGACNNDPAIVGAYTDNRSHLAWGTGPHACPAKSVAYAVAQNAIDQLFDALPEMMLACRPDELVWRPGGFHRSLAALPVEFPQSGPF